VATDQDHTNFTGDELLRCLKLALMSVLASESDYYQQVAELKGKGVPAGLAGRLINLIPILAGRRFLAASGPVPKLADHYVLVDAVGNEQTVEFAECAICQAVEWALEKLDAPVVLQLGIGSCEVNALNNMLNRLGANASESAIQTITIEAPRMGG
jgi:hypothetical protein